MPILPILCVYKNPESELLREPVLNTERIELKIIYFNGIHAYRNDTVNV